MFINPSNDINDGYLQARGVTTWLLGSYQVSNTPMAIQVPYVQSHRSRFDWLKASFDWALRGSISSLSCHISRLLLTVPGSGHRSFHISLTNPHDPLPPLHIAVQSFGEYGTSNRMVSPIVHTAYIQTGPWLVHNSRIAIMV